MGMPLSVLHVSVNGAEQHRTVLYGMSCAHVE